MPQPWRLGLDANPAQLDDRQVRAVEAELQQLTRDRTQTCQGISHTGVLDMEGTWEGFLQVSQTFYRQRLSKVAGHRVLRVEPAFNDDYIARIQRRVPGALESFVDAFSPMFLRAVHKAYHGASPADAQEVLQEIWPGLLTSLPTKILPSFDPCQGSERAYLFRIVYHRAIDCLRSRRKLPVGGDQPYDVQEPTFDPWPDHHNHEETAAFLRAFLAGCSEKQAELLNLLIKEEPSGAELARRLGIDEQAAAKRRSRLKMEILTAWRGFMENGALPVKPKGSPS